MDLDTGSIVDRYTIEGRLGEGGMAVVYRARHNQLGTLHAIKVLTIPGKSIRQRLLQEGRVQALLRHPNIVNVTDVIDVEGAPGLVMEMIEGLSLEELIEKLPLSVDQVDALARGIIDGVGEAHRHELIHRDLKPGNVMVQIGPRGPVPKVTDFGLAKVLSADEFSGTKTRSGMAMGTPCYMAPEQIRDAKTVDRRADIWALGCILYELLAKRRAFDGTDMFSIFSAVTSGQYTHIREVMPDVPERMVRAIEGCLVVDRDQRFGDCDALFNEWTGRTADASGAAAGPSLWNTELLKASSTAMSTSPSKAGGTWSGDAGVTKSLHSNPSEKPNKTMAKTSSADSLLPDEPRRPSGSPRTRKPVPRVAPTGIIAPPTSQDRADEAGRSSGATVAYVAFAIAILALLALIGVGLVSVGVAGGLLATATNAPVAPIEVPDVEPVDAKPPEVKAPVIKAPEVKSPDVTVDVKAPKAADPPKIKPEKPIKPIEVKPAPEKLIVVAPADPPPANGPKGLLIVNSRPWSNVTLDGTGAGRTGGWKRELSSGKHSVELQTADGQVIKKSIEVKASADNVFCWDFNLGAPCPQ